MIISISGTHCTGKTTLLDALKKTFDNKYIFISGVTRKLKDKGLPINNNQSLTYDKTQLSRLNHDLSILSLMKENPKQNYVLDRCILDTYIYSKYLYNQGKLDFETFYTIEKEYKQNIDSYDYFVFLSHKDIALVKDSHRNDDSSFRKDVLDLFNEELFESNIYRKVKYLKGTVVERVLGVNLLLL